jgi:hypothetical protein
LAEDGDGATRRGRRRRRRKRKKRGKRDSDSHHATLSLTHYRVAIYEALNFYLIYHSISCSLSSANYPSNPP